MIVVTSREQNNSKDLIALQNWQSNSQCLSFNAATINCESANNKTLDLTDYISEQDIDVCCLTETWMTENDPVTAGELCPPGYKLKSIPRKDRRGGGVAIILKQPLSLKPNQCCPPNSFQSFEHLNTVIIHPQCSKSINLTVVYRPPRSNKNNIPISVFFDEISELFAVLCMTPDRLLITGDFNIHVDKPEDPAAAKFLSLLQSLGLVQHVTVPTHVAGHTLDLVITREDCDLLTCSPMAHYMMSSHSTVLFPLSMAKPKRPTIVRTCRKIKSIDMDRFRSDIESSLLLSSPAENMDKFAEQYQETLSRILENHAPKVTIRVRQRALKPWYSSDIAKAKLDRRRLERRWRRSKLEVDRHLFVEARNNVSRLLLDAKTSFYSARIHELNGNQKALFREMNHLLHKSTETPLPPHDSPEVLANQFAEYFSEKIEKIRLELQCCIVQPSTTSSTQSSSVQNICELSSFDNVPIKTVSDLIASAPSKTCALDPIPTRLLKQCTDLLAPTITSMINLSLSTGTVPNELKDVIVLPTLKRKQDILTKENYRPISNLPFVSKICEKTVAVQFSNHLRENCLIEPFQSGYRANHSTETALLRVFNDILRSIDQRKVTILVLLDLSAAFDTVDHNNDTQLYLAFDFEKSQMALATIRAAICDINDWLLLNMLKFNTGKTDLCVIGSHQQLSKLNLPLAIHVEQSEMVTDESITNLGVIMDQHLKLDGHVNKVFKVCMFHLRTISKIRRFLTIEACKLLIHALVT